MEVIYISKYADSINKFIFGSTYSVMSPNEIDASKTLLLKAIEDSLQSGEIYCITMHVNEISVNVRNDPRSLYYIRNGVFIAYSITKKSYVPLTLCDEERIQELIKDSIRTLLATKKSDRGYITVLYPHRRNLYDRLPEDICCLFDYLSTREYDPLYIASIQDSLYELEATILVNRMSTKTLESFPIDHYRYLTGISEERCMYGSALRNLLDEMEKDRIVTDVTNIKYIRKCVRAIKMSSFLKSRLEQNNKAIETKNPGGPMEEIVR